VGLVSYNRNPIRLNNFPIEFDNTHFYADFFHDWIRYLRMEFGELVSREFGTGFIMPVDAMVGQDGSIYVLEYGTALSKITYIKPPIFKDIDIKMQFKNYPNPFNSSTTIYYELLENTNIHLGVYNVLGSHVRTLINQQYQQAGNYSIKWDGRDKLSQIVASGVYIYTINAGNFMQSRKMLFIK